MPGGGLCFFFRAPVPGSMDVATGASAGLSHAMMNPQPTAADRPISPGVAKAALAVERYVLPWAYGYFAWQRIGPGLEHFAAYRRLAEHGAEPMLASVAAAAAAKDLLLFLLMVFTGATLLFSRAPVTLPDRLKHLLVPVAMSYYFFLYGMVDRLPEPLRQSLLPPAWQIPAAVGGLLLSLLGYAISIWALIHLGRSFAMLVSVRKVVSTGPYAYVRHPIYLGYVIDLCGLLLTNFSPAMLLLGAGFIAFLIVRARLEEEMLSATDAGYRENVARTGFLLPRFSGRR